MAETGDTRRGASPLLGLVAFGVMLGVGCFATAALSDPANSSLPAIFFGLAVLAGVAGFGRNETWSQILGFAVAAVLAFVVINTGKAAELGRLMDTVGSPAADAVAGEGGR